MRLAARVHDRLRAAEAIDRFGDKALRPALACAFDLRGAICAWAFGFLEDADISCRQHRVGELRSGRGHRAVRQVNRRRGRPMAAKQIGDRGDGGAGALDQRMAVLRIADRGAEHLAQRQRAVVAKEQHPGLERAGHTSREQPGAGHKVEAFAAIMRDGGARRSRSLPADDFRLAAPHVIDDDRHVAARAVEMRFDHLQRERRRHRGIEGVAALLQRRHAHGGRDPVRRGDDAERAFDFRPRRERVGANVAHAGGKLTRRPPRATGPIFSWSWAWPARISAPRRSCNSAAPWASGHR